MASHWFTQGGDIEPTLEHTNINWTVPVFAGDRLVRTLVWAQFWGRVDGLAAPFGRALPGMVGMFQAKIDDPLIGSVNVHEADNDWVTWDIVNMDWRNAETGGGDFSVFYNAWLAVDVKSERTAVTDNPSACIAIHTVVLGGGDTELSQPTYSCSWAVRSLWIVR
jgi:hypothetical protein